MYLPKHVPASAEVDAFEWGTHQPSSNPEKWGKSVDHKAVVRHGLDPGYQADGCNLGWLLDAAQSRVDDQLEFG